METKEVRECLRICRKLFISDVPASITGQDQALKPSAERSLCAAGPRVGSAARNNPSCHFLGASFRPHSSRPLCRLSRPDPKLPRASMGHFDDRR